jgi:UDP-glucose 4-epimerase
MKIVVTGALGHIGSRLIRQLPLYMPDLEIELVDNLLTQRYPSLFNLPSNTRYRFSELDVTDADIRPLVEGAEAVVHLAAITDATSSFDNRDKVERVNYVATQRVAEACVVAHAPLVMLSTTSVYGTQEKRVDEFCTESELKPQSPYAETKLREENLIREMVASKGLRAIICRFGTIFGTSPGMRFHTAVNKFCWQAVMGSPLTVWKTAYDQKRPYLDLEDAIAAIAFIIERRLFDGEVYNVVTENATVRNVIDHIRAHISALQVEFVETRIMNQLSYEVANSRMSQAGFRFRGDMGRGIAETIALLRNASQSGANG